MIYFCASNLKWKLFNKASLICKENNKLPKIRKSLDVLVTGFKLFQCLWHATKLVLMSPFWWVNIPLPIYCSYKWSYPQLPLWSKLIFFLCGQQFFKPMKKYKNVSLNLTTAKIQPSVLQCYLNMANQNIWTFEFWMLAYVDCWF